MSVESLNELKQEIEDIKKMIKERNLIIQRCIDRSDFALNKKELIINGDEILEEIFIQHKLNIVA